MKNRSDADAVERTRSQTNEASWRAYEEEKKKLRDMGLSNAEYTRRVIQIADRLGL